MKRYQTGQSAEYGLYVTALPPDLRFVGADGEALDGRPGATYARLPMWSVVVLGPVAGGVFVLAFPLLVIGALVYGLALGAHKVVSERFAYVARMRWQPSMAYFDEPKDDEATRREGTDDELADLEETVRARADEERDQE
ncbi:MAG: hypothetical protein ACQEXJ_00850 [Myxococcota bacterium]